MTYSGTQSMDDSLVSESGPVPGLSFISDILKYRAHHQPDKTAFTFLLDGDEKKVSWTYENLKNAVANVANFLRMHVKKGDRVVLLFEPGLSFLTAYLATISIGSIAVPCHPPMGDRQIHRLKLMLENCRPALILCSKKIREQTRQFSKFKSLAHEINSEILDVSISNHPEYCNWKKSDLKPNDIAMLQYTSASTGDPKGVIVSHNNLLKNSEAIYNWLGSDAERKGCIWLPPYHDMGLLGTIMQPLYAGFPLVFMSPLHFLQRPLRWLKTISNHRSTSTGAPNFAFQLCVDSITDEELDAAELDLSFVREIFNGSEPIDPSTISAFYNRFSRYGLPQTAINPCYGMAEATLFVSGKNAGEAPLCQPFNRDALDDRKVKPDPQGRMLVSSGNVSEEIDLRIVDPNTGQSCEAGEVGEIWLSGPSITHGYWDNEDLTNTAFGNILPESPLSYFRTGDLGFLLDKNLYITGRIKEVIIVRGRNLYPQDIERCALTAIRDLHSGPCSAAAFGIPGVSTEKLVLAVEFRRAISPDQLKTIRTAIGVAIRGEFQIDLADIYIGPRRTISRTTSGKIQRLTCQKSYLKGSLPKFRFERNDLIRPQNLGGQI